MKNSNYQPVIDSINLLPEQIVAGFSQVKINLAKSYQACQQIVILGMGGSRLAADLLRSNLSEKLKKPVIIVSDYHLPAFVNKQSLVIAISYSGNTEEALSALKDAEKKKAKIIILTCGGRLAKLSHPKVVLTTRANPSAQPRYGLGYLLGALLAIFQKLQLSALPATKIKQLANSLAGQMKAQQIAAKKLAQALQNKIILLITAEHLDGNGLILRNQINETAKQFAVQHSLPNLNHHLLEGLSLPRDLSREMVCLLFSSKFYSLKNQQRLTLTKKIIAQQKIKTLVLDSQAKDKLSESWQCLAWGSYLSIYLSQVNKQDPLAIPWVDYLKAKLK